MSKYLPLKQYLQSVGESYIKMDFSKLEEILRFNLPKSAHTYQAWWGNGSHTHANSWIEAGYKVEEVNLQKQFVCFGKDDDESIKSPKPTVRVSEPVSDTMAIDPSEKILHICGYDFRYIQQLIPEYDANGSIIKYYPQEKYNNEGNLPLLEHGSGAFCRFSIEADDWPGVYLWVVDCEIIYIGETSGLKRRFNHGYGHISPRNCYTGGQSTNCKMNNVVLNLFEDGKVVNLYFYKTPEFKSTELQLLETIKTIHNVKNN